MAKNTLGTKLQADVVTAMKAKEKEKLGVLRMLQAAIKQVEVDDRRELTDEDILKILGSYARKVKDQIKSYRDGGRQDLLAAVEAELVIVSAYLPAELPDEELLAIVQAAVAETGAAGPQDMGKVMKTVLGQVAGRADGSRVSALVKQELAR